MFLLVTLIWGSEELAKTISFSRGTIVTFFNIMALQGCFYSYVFYNVSFYNIGQRMQIIAFLLRQIRFRAKKTIQTKTISSSER